MLLDRPVDAILASTMPPNRPQPGDPGGGGGGAFESDPVGPDTDTGEDDEEGEPS